MPRKGFKLGETRLVFSRLSDGCSENGCAGVREDAMIEIYCPRRGTDGSRSRAVRWGNREVERFEIDSDGGDRKKTAVRREIYAWKSHYNTHTRPSVQVKISGQQLSREFPLIRELKAHLESKLRS